MDEKVKKLLALPELPVLLVVLPVLLALLLVLLAVVCIIRAPRPGVTSSTLMLAVAVTLVF
uniref:Uncharacterized protein n=1 Tax=Anopheles minimus TaxID=112268 RepID=A0A182WG20_9DIPT